MVRRRQRHDATPITDREILDLILSGNLRVNFNTLEVSKLHLGRKTYGKLSGSIHPKSGRYRVMVGIGARRRTIYRNRLVWMAFHRRLIPEDCFVDHINLDCRDDSPGNLQLHSFYESDVQGNIIQAERHFDECVKFFESQSTGLSEEEF